MAWWLNRAIPCWLPLVLLGQYSPPLVFEFIDDDQLTDEELSALESHLDNPLDLNGIAAQDLWFMDDSLAAIILNSRQAHPYRSWQDFARRTQLPEAVIRELKLMFSLYREQLFQGSCATRILSNGSDERIRSRVQASGQSWSIQGTLQRDPGEYNLSDLTAFSLGIQRGNTSLLAGSQRVGWGLGLVLSNSFSPRRGTTLLRPPTELMRIRPGYSNLHSGAVRGVSLAMQLGRLRFVTGAGWHKADVMSTPGGRPAIVDNRTHSHPSSQLVEAVPWLSVSTSLRQTALGVFVGEQHLMPADTLSGSRARFVSLVVSKKYATQAGTWQIRHEEAWQAQVPHDTPGDKTRAIQSRIYFHSRVDSSGKRVRLVLIYRVYPPAWTPVRGQLFGRHVSNGNERGFYAGWEWSWKPLNLTGHTDYFQQIIPSAGPGIQRGWEAGLGASMGTKLQRTRVAYRRKGEQVWAVTETTHGLISNTQIEQVTDHFSLTYSGNIRPHLVIRLHVARSMDTKGSGAGNVFGPTLRYTTRFRTTVAAGTCLFRTNGWDQRIIVYEAGLPRELNLTPLYGSGIRLHGLISIPMENGTLSIRAAKEWKKDGADHETDSGTIRIGLQIDIAL